MFFLQQLFLTWAAIWDYWFVQRNSKSPLFRHFTHLNFSNRIYPNHDPILVSGYFPFILTPATANVNSPASVALCWHLNISRKGGLLICKGNGSSELPSLCSCFNSFVFQAQLLVGFSDNNELRFPGLLNVLLRLLWWLQCSCVSLCQRHRSVRAYISSGFGWYWTWFCDHALGFIRKNCALPDGGERWSFFTAWHSGVQIWSAGSSPGLSSAQAIQF